MSRSKSAILSLFLLLPVIFFLLHHYFVHGPDLHPTGFTVDENVLYMSYAHQYLDQENLSLFYSNPFDGNPASPQIYFQPVNFLFVPLLKMGADPGFVFSMFGLLMAFCCIYTGVRIIQHLLPNIKYQVLVSILFTWGGGLTALAGIGSSLISGGTTGPWIDSIYLADPANGWWGMNWGRTLFIPLEAYYHFLFLLNIYLLLKHKWAPVLIVTAFLSISHPFTGIEFLLIIIGWVVLEKFIYRNKAIPSWFLPGCIAIALFHTWYYLYYLNSFAEHKQLFSQYSAGWTYSFRVFIPAYLLVLIICLLPQFVDKKRTAFLSTPSRRLFLCWAVIAFLLSKHEWFIKPMQPIHFTRGYIWAGLFLLGLPGLLWLLEFARSHMRGKIVLFAFISLMLLDNTLWIGNHFREKNKTEWEGYLTDDTRQVFNFLHTTAVPNDLLIGNAGLVNYMANVYSSANAWVSHPYNTPDRVTRIEMIKQYLSTAIQPAAWANRRLLIVINKKDEQLPVHPSLKTTKLFENDTYIIFTP